MGTTVEKLNKVLETKEAIRTAINNKGGTLTESNKFSDYATAIDSLGSDWLKEYLDETKDARFLFCGYSNSGYPSTWYYNLTYERLQKILSYNTTSNVTIMNGMFFQCQELTTIPLIDTSLVTSMLYMFEGCSSLTTIPQLDTSKITSMYEMFFRCSSLTAIPQLDTSKVVDMRFAFYDCYRLAKIDITHMNITETSYSINFASDCYSLTKLIIRNMTTIPALNSNAFNNCYHFTGTTNATWNPQGLKDGRIYVPDDKVEELKTATNWSVYADIIVGLSELGE